LHNQLASLGRHAQLTRCFSAVAELLVMIMIQTWFITTWRESLISQCSAQCCDWSQSSFCCTIWFIIHLYV